MSTLRHADDDHVDAAGKHLVDAETLIERQRPDGAAYLAGYVVECAYKAVILHDVAFDPILRTHDRSKLAARHKALAGKAYGHKLTALAGATLGIEGLRYEILLGSATRPASIMSWRETRRYASPGFVSSPGASATITDEARSFVEWARVAYTQSIERMRLDGVV